MKSEEAKTRYNLAESSNEGYGSKRTVLPMINMIMIWFLNDQTGGDGRNLERQNVSFILQINIRRQIKSNAPY
jgi:hypothetical protein